MALEAQEQLPSELSPGGDDGLALGVLPLWRLAAASVVGTSHVERAAPCQDAHTVSVVESPAEGAVLVCVVADGAGSASHGGEGAEALCLFLAREIVGLISAGGRVSDLTWSRSAAGSTVTA